MSRTVVFFGLVKNKNKNKTRDVEGGGGLNCSRTGRTRCGVGVPELRSRRRGTAPHGEPQQLPTSTSNGLIARNVRTGEVWRVPMKAMEALRGLPALPPFPKPAVLARRQAALRAVSGAVSLEITSKAWRACARFFRARARLTRRVLRATREGHARGPAGLSSVCA